MPQLVTARGRTAYTASEAVGTNAECIADFRSDTVTKPPKEMLRRAIEVEMDDDVYQGDANVQRLERRVADMCRKEAALFCVSGTMTNQLALRSVMHPMESVLVDSRSHLYLYEVG